MNNIIKFSHKYQKFPEDYAHSQLIDVLYTNAVSPFFETYDCMYLVDNSHVRFYSLPSGKKIVLLLKTRKDVLWTTLRKYTPEKDKYYQSKIGQWFYCDVVQEPQ